MSFQDYRPPTISTFDPTIIPYQYEVIKNVRQHYDYSLGVHEILLSGAIGSSKSTIMAHTIVTHCLIYKGARALIGRLSMPSLRATLFNKILEHIGNDLIEGKDYEVNQTTASIKFRNGSEILSRSWSDKKYFKVRSLELSCVGIDELTETDTDDFYKEIKMRVGRIPQIKENIIISATNPGDPSSWQYKYFIQPNSGGINHRTRHVFYSKTSENPFLPPQYLQQLKSDLDPKEARRMLLGEWLSLRDDVIYYEYNSDVQYRKEKWRPREGTPISISWDFNIGDGKPLSAVAMCYQDGAFHIFEEVVVDGARTEDALDEFFERGIIRQGPYYEIDGDASGKSRSTNSKHSDYDIIKQRLSQEGINYGYRVRLSNPPVRTRHNLVNAYCRNSLGEVRLFVWNCKTADEGLRLTALKNGSSYVEDDSKRFQHITTAIGYCIARVHKDENRSEQRTVIL